MFDTSHLPEGRLGEPDAPFRWGAPPDWLSEDPEGNTGFCFSGEDPFPLSNDELADGVAGAAPGPLLGRRLAMIDVALLTEDQALDVVAAMDRQAAFEAARRYQALARLGRITMDDIAADASPEAIAAAGPDRLAELLRMWRISALAARTGTSQGVAARRMSTAAALAPGGLLGATGAALAVGAICDQRARLIADRLLCLDAELAAELEAAVLPLAPAMSWTGLDNAIRRETIARRPHEEEVAHATARRERKVTRPSAQPAGMASMGIFGPAEDLHQLWTAMDARARQAKAADAKAATKTAIATSATATAAGTPDSLGTDAPSMDARRFDALAELANAVLGEPDLPRRHGRRPAITVTVGLSTLLGLDDHPAELQDYGPITADAARRIAADPTGTLRRLVLDPVGRATDYGTTRYAPPRDLCDFVIARDRTCVFPSCTRRAISCDLDHRVPFPHGSTSERNLHSLCRTHHQLKTLGLWTYRHDPATGQTQWTDRHGRTITGAAATYDAPPTPELDQIARAVRAASPPPAPVPEPGKPDADDDPPPF